MIKSIKSDKIRKFIKNIYESSSDIKVSQEELEDMLTELDKINLEYSKGKISREIFEENKKKLTKESLSIIKKINKIVDNSLMFIKSINEEVLLHKIKKGDSHGSKGNKHK